MQNSKKKIRKEKREYKNLTNKNYNNNKIRSSSSVWNAKTGTITRALTKKALFVEKQGKEFDRKMVQKERNRYLNRSSKNYSNRIHNEKKTVSAIYLMSVVMLILGLSYASVPLYQLFCQATGFGGTTQKEDVAVLTKGNIKTKENITSSRATLQTQDINPPSAKE